MSVCKNCGKSLKEDYAQLFQYCPNCIEKGYGKDDATSNVPQKQPAASVPASSDKDPNSNGVASTLFGIGVITILAGLVLCVKDWGQYISNTVPLLYLIGGFISGMFFIGMGEIISLLQAIRNKDNCDKSPAK